MFGGLGSVASAGNIPIFGIRKQAPNSADWDRCSRRWARAWFRSPCPDLSVSSMEHDLLQYCVPCSKMAACTVSPASGTCPALGHLEQIDSSWVNFSFEPICTFYL
ncbi:Protein SERAC1 [Manis javanica]|nr:Protein SERAC1 [Manis javanica]